MRRLSLFVVSVFGLLSAAMPTVADDTVDYIRDIKPILSDSCYTCHGPDEGARKADLRFDHRDVAIAHAIVPGDSAASEIVARVISDDPEVHMPPPTSQRPKLTAAQIEQLKKWIDQGANYQKHWAYEPPRRPAVPSVENTAAVSNPIDNFVVARLEREGLYPSPTADNRTLLRRLHFDVTGLPPLPEVVATYSQQLESPSTYRTLVNRLLSSQAFAERLTAYWLDVVRYGDSVGIHGDQLVSMSPYRDYVLESFHENMPYDQFITEQLAGDLLPSATRGQKIASAFNRMHMITAEGGAQAKEYLAIYAADRVRNTSAALLGTTLGCAQCHDHKFDPFSAKEFYEFASFFADLKETGVYGGSNWFPKLQVPEPGQAEELAKLVALMKKAEGDVPKDAEKDDPKKKAFDRAKKEKANFEKTIPTVLVSQSVKPREMRLLPRGNWQDDSGPVVQPGFPATLSVGGLDVIAPETGRLQRTDLAKWMTHPDNPLVARVFVNRLWKLMMGEGIVTSLDDFGSQGEVPSHPQLLDWLAVEFMESGWDIKHMVRLIVSSKTYRQSSAVLAELRERDPENRLLARQNRFRLDAEGIRDNALVASGLLVDKFGGKSVRPYQPEGYYAHLNFPRRKYQASSGEDLYRRSVYTHWQRTFVHPSLMAFDAPSREECTVRRPRSNTPLQSLVLFNDPIYVEAARKLAERVMKSADSKEERLAGLFDFVLQRAPSSEEKQVLMELYEKHIAKYHANNQLAKEVGKNGDAPVAEEVDAAELAAWTSLSRTMLSLHETITRS